MTRSSKNLKFFDYQISICIMLNSNIFLKEIEDWMTSTFEKGYHWVQMSSTIITYGFNSEEDLVLFKLTWGEYCL